MKRPWPPAVLVNHHIDLHHNPNCLTQRDLDAVSVVDYFTSENAARFPTLRAAISDPIL